ncbi:substrate-binding periplasmic protein [Kordiimonas sp.]|uniref:substrate-binding periplasmic protein n=1 Tax=Kordiimonas sp. TaxID=1970157 RepID=UPI003A93BC70
MRVIFLPLAFMFSLALSVAGQAESLKILAGQIPHVFHQETPGPHNQFFQQIIRPRIGDHEVQFLSYRRAMRDFAERQADCLYIAIDSIDDYPIELDERQFIRFSNPINRVGLRLYTRPDDVPVTAYDDLKSKVIVGAGSHLKILEPHIGADWGVTTLEVETGVKAFELLDKHRVDVVISVDFDTRLLEKAKGLQSYSYDKDLEVVAWNEVMTCWYSEKTDRILTSLNLMLQAAKDNGTLIATFQ